MRTFEKTILNIILCTLCCGVASAESAKSEWTQIVGKHKKRPAFAFVENNPASPNVLIYGDSISIGYTIRVRKNLKDSANVYRLHANGGDSGSVITKMTKMHDTMSDESLDHPWAFQWDVIHFNVGLHDLKYLLNRKLDKKRGTQVASISAYKKNLIDIIAYLKKLSPQAKLIFATTTPVPEGTSGRIAGDAKKYNTAALEVMREFPEIEINDLHSLTEPNHEKWWIKPGDVHFNNDGKNAQGDAVAKIILKALKERDTE